MSASPTGDVGSSGSDNPRPDGMSNTLTTWIQSPNYPLWRNGSFWNAADFGISICCSLSAGYANIKVGIYEESSRIQAWLSPLSPGRRYQELCWSRFGGIGDWVLQKNEFQTWCKGEDGSVDPILLCYGDRGVGKTYLR